MIGLALGTVEGRRILELLNKRTGDIFISTATDYGKTIYSGYRYNEANCEPMDEAEFIKTIEKHKITLFGDATHPYAVNVSENLLSACKKCGIKYARYEREGVAEKYIDNKDVITVDSFNDMKEALLKIDGTIMNTLGSKSVKSIVDMKLKNRVIHRVLPTSKVISEMERQGVTAQDIVAIKMDLGVQQINDALIEAYSVKTMLAKDSGKEGGTEEKIKSALRCKIKIIILKRTSAKLPNTFNNIEEFADYCMKEGSAQ